MSHNELVGLLTLNGAKNVSIEIAIVSIVLLMKSDHAT